MNLKSIGYTAIILSIMGVSTPSMAHEKSLWDFDIFTQKHKYLSDHTQPKFRHLKNQHANQWQSTDTKNANHLIRNFMDLGLIHKITSNDELGYVHVSKDFMALSSRDQKRIADNLYRFFAEKKGESFGAYFIKNHRGKMVGTYTKYGLDIY